MSQGDSLLKRIHSAVEAAFDRAALSQVVAYCLGARFENLTAEKNFRSQLFELITTLDREGRTLDLLSCLKAERPHNTLLADLYAEAEQRQAQAGAGTPIFVLETAPSPSLQPRFVTDRLDGNQLGFTVTNPPQSPPIRITDIAIISGFVRTFCAAAEERFDLSEVVIPSPTSSGDHQILADLSTTKSIFYDKQVVRIDQNDAASFRLSLFADASFSQSAFTLSITYIDNGGQRRNLSSDAIYAASKSFGTNAIEHVGVMPFSDLLGKLQMQDCSVLDLLPFFQESDFAGLDVFDLLMDIQRSGKCVEHGAPALIELIGNYTNTQARRDATLSVIRNLDDVTDFEEKYHFIVNLVRVRDERVIPFALSLLPKIKIRRQLKWSGSTTAYLALFRLQDMLATYLGVKVSACQEALETKG